MSEGVGRTPQATIIGSSDARCCTIPITSRISGFVCDYY